MKRRGIGSTCGAAYRRDRSGKQAARPVSWPFAVVLFNRLKCGGTRRFYAATLISTRCSAWDKIGPRTLFFFCQQLLNLLPHDCLTLDLVPIQLAVPAVTDIPF